MNNHTPQQNRRVPSAFPLVDRPGARIAAFFAGVSVALLGATALAGWLLHQRALRNIFPGSVDSTNPNLAAAMLLCGFALSLLSRKTLTNSIRTCAAAAAAAVITLCIMTMAEYSLGWDLGIDGWLIGDADTGLTHFGRLKPITAFCFGLAAAALFTASQRIQKGLRLTLVAGLGGILIGAGVVPMVGFFLETTFGAGCNFMGVGASSLPAALAFLLLGSGILALLSGNAHLKWSLSRSTTAGFAIGFVLMMLAAGLTYNFTLRVHATQKQVSHTQQVLTEIEEIEAAISNLENQQRGYIITGNERLLEEWDDDEFAIREHVGKLQELAADNSAQRPRISQLAALMSERVSRANQAIAARREGGFPAAQELIASGTTIGLLVQSRAVIKEIEKDERRRLDERQADSDFSSQRAFLMLPLGLFLCMAVLSLGFFFLNAGTGERKRAELSLRRSEEGTRAILDSALDCIITMDHHGRVTEFNPAAEKTFGYRREEAIGQLLSELIIPPSRRERHQQGLDRYFATGRGQALDKRLELSAVRRDGSEFPIELAIIRVGTQEPPMFTGFIRDITEREAAAKNSSAQEKQYRLLFDGNPTPIWVFDVQSLKILAVNQAAISSYGYSREEFLARTLRDIRPAEDVASLVESLWDAAAPAGYGGEWRHLKKDGTVITADVYSSPTMFDNKEARMALAVDLTERTEAAKQLRAAEEKYRSIFDNASEGIFQNTPEGVILSANPALARMLGFASPEELIRERNAIQTQTYVDPAQRAKLRRLLEQNGTVDNFEYEVKRKDGSTIFVSENIRLVRDAAGKTLYYEGTMQEITERKRAESSLIKSQQRLDLARKAAQIGIWDWNVVTNELIWDERMYDLYGVREHDFSGAYSAWQNGLHPDDRVRAEAEIMTAVKSADGFHTEFRVIRPDGIVRNIEAHAIAEHASDGSTTRMIGVNFDITDRKRIDGELQRQQSELRVLFDLMPAMIWFKDCENGIIRINQRVADAAGKSVEEIEGRSCFEIYPEQAAGYFADDLEVIGAGKPKLGIVEKILGAAGEALWVQTDKVPVFDPFGNVIGIVVMAQDVTARRKSEESLRLLNSAVLQSNEAILITDAELDLPGPRIVFANPAFTAMTGYEAAEVIGQTPRILQGPRTDKAVLARLRQTLKQGEVFKGEAINYRKDGTEFDLEWQIAPIRDANDHVTHFVALQRDITARRQTEQTQARFAAIMAATPDFVGVADGNGRMLYMNSAGRKMVGFAEDEDVTRTIIEDHVAKSQFPRLMEECIPTAIRDGAWSGEMTFVDRKGREIPLSQVIVTRKTPAGGIDFVATTAQDLTERKKAETALEDANRQLLQASRLAGMAEVATSVLHNVGNVLNSVNVSCSVISDRVRGSRISSVTRTAELLAANSRDLPAFFTNDPIGRKLPDFISKLAARLTAEQADILGELQLLGQNIEHIKDIVAVQQNHAKDIGGVRETLPIEGLVEDALRMNAGSLVRHRIEVVREYGEAPAFSLEKHKVIQILVNLVRNAKHALTDGGRDDKRLLVRVARRNGNVAVSVSDNGIGIAPENKIRIFSHGFTTKKDGHGFGLHSGFLAAQEMGGSLVAQSDGPGMGATFTLELPLHGQGKN